MINVTIMPNSNVSRPQGIKLQILLVMLFRISLKIPHYAHYMLVIVIIMLIIQCTIKRCNVKLQIVYDNIYTHIILYYYKVSACIVL